MSTASRHYSLIFNVLDYGANNYAGGVDCAPAFQAAIDAAVNAVNSIAVSRDAGAIIEVPAGHYEFFSPVRLNGNRITVRGDARATSGLFPRFGGAFWVQASAAAVVNTTAGLTTSGGLALSFAPGTDLSTGLFSLRDVPGGDIHGLSAICVETFFRPTSLGLASLVECSAIRISGDSRAGALHIAYDGTGALSAHITTTGGTTNITAAAGTLTAGVTKHVALTYDGTTLRLFVAGVLVGSGAASGTIIQQPYEDFTIGKAPAFWPEFGAYLNAPDGAIDSFRLSDAAIYTAGFTPPTAKLGQLSSTRILINVATVAGSIPAVTGSLTQIQSKFGFGYLLFRPQSLLSNSLAYTNLENLSFYGGGEGAIGPIVQSTQNGHFNGITVESMRQGLALYDNCYQNEVHDYRAGIQDNSQTSQGSRFGFVGANAAGILRLDRFHVTGGAYPIMLSSASGTYDHLFIETQARTIWGFTAKAEAGGADSHVLRGLIINNESGGQPVEYAVVISTNPLTLIDGATIFFFGGTPYNATVFVNGGGVTALKDWQIVLSAPGPSQLIDIGIAPTLPVIVEGFIQSLTVPLTLTPASVRQVGAPVYDLHALVQGSTNLDRFMRFEIDGMPSGTSVITPPSALLVLMAALNVAQLFTAIQSFNQRLQGEAGSGTNQAGTSTLALAGGPGTGTAAAQLLVQKFWLKQASGTTAHVASSGDYPIGSVMHNQVTDVTIVNTVSELTIFTTGVAPSTTTIEAGMERIGRRFLIRASGEFGFTGTPTLTIRMKCGGSTIATITVTTAAGDAGRWSLDVTLTIVVAGSAGTINVDNSFFTYSNTAGGISTGRNPSAVGSLNPVDFTSSKALDVTAQWSAADPANSFQCYTALITIIP